MRIRHLVTYNTARWVKILKDLNLIPKSYIEDKKNKVKKTYYSIIILIVGFVFVAGYIIPTIFQMSLSKERDAIQLQVNETSDFVSIENKFLSLKNAVKHREETSEKLASLNNNVFEIINVLERASPEYLTITNMATSSENANLKIKLKGAANNEYTVASYIRNLKNEDFFESIELIDLTKNQSGNGYIFNINISGLVDSQLLTYSNFGHSFSISYPKDWEIKAEEENNIIILPRNDAISGSPASIQISISDVSSTIDVSVKDRINNLKESKIYENIFSHKTKLRGNDAYINMYYHTNDGIEYRLKEICVIKGNKLFTVSYLENSLEFSNNSRKIDKVLNSLYIK